MADAFVSYSRKDLKLANQIAARLRGGGYEIWMDSDIPSGAVWRKSVAEAIAESKAFLLLLSPNATGSDHVLNELDLAEKKRRIILPVLIAPTTIPPEMELSIGRLHRIDASADMADAGKRLLDALKKLRAVDEDDPGWTRFAETKKGREMLTSILTDPALTVEDKTFLHLMVHSLPSKDQTEWQEQWDRVQSRFAANEAECNTLEKEREEITKEWAAAKDRALRSRTRNTGAVDREFLAKIKAFDPRLAELQAERRELAGQETALMEELSKEQQKVMDKSRELLERSNRLIERIWK